MKCCSLKRKDLNHHYKKMSGRNYMLNEELQFELYRHIASTQRNLKDIFLGEIYQMAFFEKVCKKLYLQIKCKHDKCSCRTKKKKRFLPKEGRKNCRFQYFRKKQIRGFKKSNRCYICKKERPFCKTMSQ
ncbi:hypothetical protein ACOSP7_031255 [Xanthoceras sorbifolium]